jgi:hypothetical protein
MAPKTTAEALRPSEMPRCARTSNDRFGPLGRLGNSQVAFPIFRGVVSEVPENAGYFEKL